MRPTMLMVCLILSVAVVASACGGAVDSDGVNAGQSPTSVSTAGPDPAALELIDEFGSDDAAANALIIAMDRGYSGPQIVDAVDGNHLNRDGTIDGQEPASPALNLVLYDLDDVAGKDEGALGLRNRPNVVLISTMQVEQTPLEQMRSNAANNFYGVGDPAAALILRMLKANYAPKDVIEALIFGIDGSADYPDDPDSPISCIVIVDELICPGGERFPAPTEPKVAQDETAAEATTEPEPEASAPERLVWEGEMTPDPKWVKAPVAGSYVLTRTAGTDEFQITLHTVDAKSGEFTLDGFNTVECGTEWSSVFEGTGTFWDINDLGIEFTGEITRSIVYTWGPCDSILEPETTDFSGVVVSITDEGIELGFNAWEFSVPGSRPVPIRN